jgi:hypothetical protein
VSRYAAGDVLRRIEALSTLAGDVSLPAAEQVFDRGAPGEHATRGVESENGVGAYVLAQQAEYVRARPRPDIGLQKNPGRTRLYLRKGRWTLRTVPVLRVVEFVGIG